MVFFKRKRFFYIAKVASKLHSPDLARLLWGANSNGDPWEYIYFIKEGKQIDVPYKPEILKTISGRFYKSNHIVQGASLLNIENTTSMLKHINSSEGDILDEELIEPTEKDTKAVENTAFNVHTAEDAEKKIKEITDSINEEPVREKIKLAKTLVRNPKYSRLIKEKASYLCEICGAKPFIQKNGLPYAEAHHKYELAKNRVDNPKDMICVCPTCHRILHYGNKGSLEKRYKLNNH